MSSSTNAATVILALWAALWGMAFARADEASQYKGYTAINQTIRERLMDEGSTFNIGKYLGENRPEPRANGGLIALLGTYVGSDLDAGFRNGQPNPMNATLWYLALGGLAKDLAKQCDETPARIPLHPGFRSLLASYCAWPADSLRSEDQLYSYWTYLMGFDAPNEEFEAWSGFARSQEVVAMPPKAAIQALTIAAWYNPYFLLRP